MLLYSSLQSITEHLVCPACGRDVLELEKQVCRVHRKVNNEKVHFLCLNVWKEATWIGYEYMLHNDLDMLWKSLVVDPGYCDFSSLFI